MQNVAFMLIGTGILIVIVWAVQGFLMSSVLVRIGIGFIGVGMLVLIRVAIKDRLVKPKQEDFKENEK